MTPSPTHFPWLLKACRKGTQPLDFHYHDGTTSSAQHIHHWWVFWHKAAISQLWSCYRRKDRALLKDAVCFRSTSAGCAMSGDSSVFMHFLRACLLLSFQNGVFWSTAMSTFRIVACAQRDTGIWSCLTIMSMVPAWGTTAFVLNDGPKIMI